MNSDFINIDKIMEHFKKVSASTEDTNTILALFSFIPTKIAEIK